VSTQGEKKRRLQQLTASLGAGDGERLSPRSSRRQRGRSEPQKTRLLLAKLLSRSSPLAPRLLAGRLPPSPRQSEASPTTTPSSRQASPRSRACLGPTTGIRSLSLVSRLLPSLYRCCESAIALGPTLGADPAASTAGDPTMLPRGPRTPKLLLKRDRPIFLGRPLLTPLRRHSLGALLSRRRLLAVALYLD